MHHDFAGEALELQLAGEEDPVAAATIEQLTSIFGFDPFRAAEAVRQIGDKADVQMAYNWLLDHGAEDKGGHVVPQQLCPHVAQHVCVGAGALSVAGVCRGNEGGGAGDGGDDDDDDATLPPSCPSGENWVCLQCNGTRCSRYVRGHNLEHYQRTKAAAEAVAVRSDGDGDDDDGDDGDDGDGDDDDKAGHCVAVSLSDLSVWCYACEAYIKHAALQPLLLQLESLKFKGAPLPPGALPPPPAPPATAVCFDATAGSALAVAAHEHIAEMGVVFPECRAIAAARGGGGGGGGSGGGGGGSSSGLLTLARRLLRGGGGFGGFANGMALSAAGADVDAAAAALLEEVSALRRVLVVEWGCRRKASAGGGGGSDGGDGDDEKEEEEEEEEELELDLPSREGGAAGVGRARVPLHMGPQWLGALSSAQEWGPQLVLVRAGFRAGDGDGDGDGGGDFDFSWVARLLGAASLPSAEGRVLVALDGDSGARAHVAARGAASCLQGLLEEGAEMSMPRPGLCTGLAAPLPPAVAAVAAAAVPLGGAEDEEGSQSSPAALAAAMASAAAAYLPWTCGACSSENGSFPSVCEVCDGPNPAYTAAPRRVPMAAAAAHEEAMRATLRRGAQEDARWAAAAALVGVQEK